MAPTESADDANRRHGSTVLPSIAEPREPDPAQLIVGTWRNDILEDATMTFNSAGRAYTSFGSCLGSYTVDGSEIRLEYDEGQPNCFSMGSSLRFDTNDHVTMSSAPYTRVDSEDVADLAGLSPQAEPPQGTGSAAP